MKHNLIKTDNYLLVVDNDLEIKEGDKVLYNDLDILTTDKFDSWFTKWDFVEKSIPPVKYINNCKKIIAHLPLNGAQVLEGVPILPPLPKEYDIEELANKLTNHLTFPEEMREGIVYGYNIAKEKYKYTEEDLFKMFVMGHAHGLAETPDTEMTARFNLSMQFLQHHPKYPIAFWCEMRTKQMPEFHEDLPKIITNSEGRTEWVGKYVWE